jgi:hypothetical protein
VQVEVDAARAMVSVKARKHCLSFLFLTGALLAAAGCDNIALIGRPTVEVGSGLEEIEFVAEVESFDAHSRQLYLRTSGGERKVVSFTPATRVIIEGREYPVTDLKSGDRVVMQLHKDPRGNEYTDLIRVRKNLPGQGGTVRE